MGRAVIPYVHHAQANIRGAAVGAIAVAGKPTNLVFEALNEALRDPNPGVRAGTLWSIHRGNVQLPIDQRFLPAVLAALGDAYPLVRAQACTTAGLLGRQGNAQVAHSVVEAIAPRLRDEEVGVRIPAASALATLWENGREAIPVLEALPPDADENVRNEVASALRSLREVYFSAPIQKPSTNTGTGEGL